MSVTIIATHWWISLTVFAYVIDKTVVIKCWLKSLFWLRDAKYYCSLKRQVELISMRFEREFEGLNHVTVFICAIFSQTSHSYLLCDTCCYWRSEYEWALKWLSTEPNWIVLSTYVRQFVCDTCGSSQFDKLSWATSIDVKEVDEISGHNVSYKT